MKWVPMSPFVVHPQIKNVPARIRKGLVLETFIRSLRLSAAVKGPLDSSIGVSVASPNGRNPTSEGLFRNKIPKIIMMNRASPATVKAVTRQPFSVKTKLKSGKNIKEPVAYAAEKTPVMTPRCLWNHRPATKEAKTKAKQPVAKPTSTPQVKINPSGVGNATAKLDPTATSARANVATLRIENLSIMVAAKGAVMP
jgi:hypothetical protein